MRKQLPLSLVFFVLTGIVLLFQLPPVPGIFLVILGAAAWSVALVNLGMLGTASEAIIGRISRWWLVLPIAFYGGYFAVAVADHVELYLLSSSFEAVDANVTTGFDSTRQALVFDSSADAIRATKSYALPVAYTADSNVPEGYLSYRLMDGADCKRVRDTRMLGLASISVVGVYGGTTGQRHKIETLCTVSIPERPKLPVVRVSRKEQEVWKGTLPIREVTTTISMPNGHRFQLLGGVASPLAWLPEPIMGCVVMGPGGVPWDCDAGFHRNEFTPIPSDKMRRNRDSLILSRALGLEPVMPNNRRGADPRLIRRKIAVARQAALKRQLANIDAIIADPFAKVKDWHISLVTHQPELLTARANSIMTAIERASATRGTASFRTSRSGRILTRLLAALPKETFDPFGPRILSLYARADGKHWLWEADALLRRMGELGPVALPYLVSPRALHASGPSAVIEGLCRVGDAARTEGKSILLSFWNRSVSGDSDRRAELFVAMRRIGISPPPLADDRYHDFDKLHAEWADITPQSPSHVCATHAEEEARRQARSTKQRTKIH